MDLFWGWWSGYSSCPAHCSFTSRDYSNWEGGAIPQHTGGLVKRSIESWIQWVCPKIIFSISLLDKMSSVPPLSLSIRTSPILCSMPSAVFMAQWMWPLAHIHTYDTDLIGKIHPHWKFHEWHISQHSVVNRVYCSNLHCKDLFAIRWLRNNLKK